ncbi:hypothetical protein BU17DRAFT_86548 [Hysterangium stoloniferum]|nr:hypothetical protein BU17DRAFT_86548 [Hysterangium stoloniferum]
MLRTPQPPTLHVSALSDADYAAYIVAFGAGGSRGVSSVREARGWIRGRYGAYVDGTIIDQILKNFAPELGPQDVLTGGQFFAVMRVVCHPQYGAAVDDSLVFVPANPEPFSSASDSKKACIKSDVALSRHSSQPTARPSIPTPPSTSSNSFTRAQSQSQSELCKPPTEPPPPHLRTPFRISLQKSPAAFPLNPLFRPRHVTRHQHATPPLPPHKLALLHPLRHGSLARLPVGVSSSSKSSSTYTPLHRITKRSRSRSRNHPLSLLPDDAVRRRPNHRFPFGDIADQDHHHGRSRERGGGEGWYSINELDAKLWASSNPGPNLTGSGPSMTDALQCTFAALCPGAGFESVRVRAEGRVLPGVFEDGEGGREAGW